jgi:DNA-binding transcriptional ArsR family regulator
MSSLDGTLSALAHPVRRSVLARLQQGETAVNELARSLRVSGPALTRHLHVLESAGLITRSRRAQQRPCQLRARPLVEIDSWLETYRGFWTETTDRLEEHLRVMKSKKQETANTRRQEEVKKHDKRV